MNKDNVFGEICKENERFCWILSRPRVELSLCAALLLRPVWERPRCQRKCNFLLLILIWNALYAEIIEPSEASTADCCTKR